MDVPKTKRETRIDCMGKERQKGQRGSLKGFGQKP